ncbi:hypothetical protein H0H92_009391, partial [Tricholoma furcatifolium]
VTGVNGFVGSNVAFALLNAGYEVRGTIRGDKVKSFKDAIGDKFPALEVVQVDDVTTADLGNVLKGPKDNLNIAIEGHLNILRQAVKAGISKVVITGSYSATFDDWNPATEEEFLSGAHNENPMWIYCAAKALGERAAWKFANENPSLDLSVVIPPFIFGPYVPGFPIPGKSALSSNQHIYTLLTGALPPPLPPLFCDVRDVARAHVAALSVSKATIIVEQKRFLVSGGTLIWRDAVEYLHEARPELKDRIPALDTAFVPFPGPISTIDAARAKKALKMESYCDWRGTLSATVDSLLEAEKNWVNV